MIGLPGWWLLPVAAFIGVPCAAFARSYVAHIHDGRPLDAAMLRSVVGHTFRLTTPRFKQTQHQQDRKAQPNSARGLALFCSSILLVAAGPFAIQPSLANLSIVVAVAGLTILGVIDARTGFLPDALTMPMLWLGISLAWFDVHVALHDAVAAAALGYLFPYLSDVAFRFVRGYHGLGGGDMKLLAALGAWFGCTALPSLLLAACVLGIAASWLRYGGRAWARSMAFGPFLSLAGGIGLIAEPVVQFLF